MRKPRTFRPAHMPTAAAARDEYEARRGSARQRGYDARWDAAAGRHKRLNPLCIGCRAIGRIRAVEVTDHVVPHRGDPAIFWDEGNWQSACAWHHDVIKARLERMFDLGEVDAAALHLDSEHARRLTILLTPTPT